MPKLGKGKVGLYISISEEVLKKFKELVLAKHGKFRDALSYEVEQALAHWLLEHARAQPPASIPTIPPSQVSGLQLEARRFNPPIRYLRVWLEVKEYLEKKLLYDFTKTRQVYVDDLRMAIGAVRGSERRTLERWMETFEKYGILKRISPKFYEVAVS
jgi:hypothetical protein